MHKHADSKIVIAATVVLLLGCLYLLVLSPLVINKPEEDDAAPVVREVAPLTPANSEAPRPGGGSGGGPNK